MLVCGALPVLQLRKLPEGFVQPSNLPDMVAASTSALISERLWMHSSVTSARIADHAKPPTQ